MSHGGAILTVDIDADNLVIACNSEKRFDRITGFTESAGYIYDPRTSTPEGATGMSFSAHHLFAVLLTILTLPTSLWAQTAPKETTNTARGSISGRVTLKGKGVFGAAVALRKNEPGWNAYERVPRAMTDQDGVYRFTNIAAGSYELRPVVPAFVPSDDRESRATVLLGEDENVENIDFT